MGPALATLPAPAWGGSKDDGWYTPAQVGAEDAKVIMITGANSGIGLAAAGKLARAGHQVVLVCRTAEKAERACQQVEVCSARRHGEARFDRVCNRTEG
jgi:NADPH:quinone reductase-like Zn-dependent oxidoreductase